MGVYINGMEMPKEYAVIIKIYPDGRIGKIPYVQWFQTDLVEGVQAVPVPPHGRLGDMDAIARKIRRFGDYVDFTKDEIAGWFENGDFETIIPAEEGE